MSDGTVNKVKTKDGKVYDIPSGTKLYKHEIIYSVQSANLHCVIISKESNQYLVFPSDFVYSPMLPDVIGLNNRAGCYCGIDNGNYLFASIIRTGPASSIANMAVTDPSEVSNFTDTVTEL